MPPEFTVFIRSQSKAKTCQDIILAAFPDAQISDVGKPQKKLRVIPVLKALEKPRTDWKKEILELKLLIHLITQTASAKNKNTLQGFKNLFLALPQIDAFLPLKKQHESSQDPELTKFINDVLDRFNSSLKDCDGYSPQYPLTRNSAGRLKLYPQPGDLTLREIRLLVFTHGLYDQAKTPETLAHEEGIKITSIAQAQHNAKAKLVWSLIRKHHQPS